MGMAEPDLKLDIPCPRCGTNNLPIARRCRHCHLEFGYSAERVSGGNLIDLTRSFVICGTCGKSNYFNSELCADCGSEISQTDTTVQGMPLGELEAAVGNGRRTRPRRRHTLSASALAARFTWLARVGAVLFLFYGVWDTGSWLSASNKDLPPGDPAGLRYTMFAIYELVRNLCVAVGVWLLTLVRWGLKK
jgi:ribosomal protein L37E